MRYFLICVVFFISACAEQNFQFKPANNSLDAGREFIDACLKGDFERARFFMIKNNDNEQLLQKIESEYRKNDRDKREQYREASINIAEITEITDSVTIVNYKNSYDKIAKKVKVVKVQDYWLVDFAYTFNPNL
ncbi:MAG: hypothetical protein ACOVNY_04250 [Chitinophagaceae bacterium]